MLQMFIAVINENFSVAEEAKRAQQASNYFQTQEPDKNRMAWIHKFNPYRWFKPSPRAIVVENLPSSLVLPMQKSVVQDYGMSERRPNRVRLFPSSLSQSPFFYPDGSLCSPGQ
jgi:voltage-dependent calcium channel